MDLQCDNFMLGVGHSVHSVELGLQALRPGSAELFGSELAPGFKCLQATGFLADTVHSLQAGMPLSLQHGLLSVLYQEKLRSRLQACPATGSGQ